MGMLIGIAGNKGSGKSTVAAGIADIGFVRMSFAGALKDIAGVLFYSLGYSKEDVCAFYADKEAIIPSLGVSLRHALQTLGTDWGRSINPDLWVKCVEHKLKDRAFCDADVIFDDVRFENEANFIRSNGGVIVHIYRPGCESDGHASEAGIRFVDGDIAVKNTGSISDLLDSAVGALAALDAF